MPSENALAELRAERRQRQVSDRRTWVVLLQVAVAISIAYVISQDSESPVWRLLDGFTPAQFWSGLFVVLAGSSYLFTRWLRRDADRLETLALVLGNNVVALAVAIPVGYLLMLSNIAD